MIKTSPLRQYVKNVWETVYSTIVGMRITGRYLRQKPITVQYPDECLPIPDRFRGIHYLEQEKCIYCQACAKACPVDCIEMNAVRHGKEAEWISFTIDYQKCMFCELCVYPCPSDCIHMSTEFALVSDKREDFVHDLLSYKGMSDDARVRMKEAAAKKAAKKKAMAEKKAKEAAEKKAAEAKEATEVKPDEVKPSKAADAKTEAEAKKDAPQDAKDGESGEKA